MSATAQPAPETQKLILIVDDTPTNIGVISGALKDSYRTKIATNGEKALALAGAEEKPDLILLDIMMPGMDGYEVCTRLKADPATREIPVIFLTTSLSPLPSSKPAFERTSSFAKPVPNSRPNSTPSTRNSRWLARFSSRSSPTPSRNSLASTSPPATPP